MAHRTRELIRELLPHAIWDGIKYFALPLVGAFGISAAMVALIQRIHKNLDIATIVVAGVISFCMLLAGMFLGGRRVVVESQAAPEPEDRPLNKAIITLQATKLDPRSADPNITYKAKLRLVFTNESGQAIHISAPRWTTGTR
jgi:hypothetical protein